MIDLQKYKNNQYFKKISLKKDDILYSEWVIDNNLYFIEKWSVVVEKHSKLSKETTKMLSILGENDFVGEWSIKEDVSNPKEVQIRANEDTTLLYINWKTDLKKFIESSPADGYELMKYIIIKWNERLLSSNKEVTINYEINKAINSVDKIDLKNIFMLIDFIRLIIGCNYILYLENNEVYENILTLRYDSRGKWKLQDITIEIDGRPTKQDLRKSKIYLWKYNIFVKLNIGKYNLGYLVFWNNVFPFQKELARVIESICTSITGLLRQRKIMIEERNKEYIKDNI